jgi:two-component system, NarL family, invasion response regulator UvrY
MKILIADDHPMIHRGLNYLIRDNFAQAEIGNVYDGNTLFDLLQKTGYEILVLDINMPDFSYLQFEKILEKQPSLKILIYSQSPEGQFALRYLKGGALGYVEKTMPDEVFIKALQNLCNGHKYVSMEVMDQMTEQLKGKLGKSPFEKLSNREFDVVMLLLKGYNFNEISEQLHISPSTVSTYKLRIFEKLNIKNHVEMLEMAKLYNIK